MPSGSNFSKAITVVNQLLSFFEIQTHSHMSKAAALSPIGRSALFMAAGRAVESSKSETERAFYDPFAHLFAQALGQKYLRKMSKYAVSYIKFRTLYIDEHISNIVRTFTDFDAEQNIQVMILGVGCDARSYRLQCLVDDPSVTVFELDLMDVISYRQQIFKLAQHNMHKMQCKVVPIVVDFRNEEWIDSLLRAGYDVHACNIWVVEGLFPFLTKTEINRLLRQIDANCRHETGSVSRHWLIGNFLNQHTMLQSKLNELNKQNGDATCKTGYKLPHLLLEQHKYKQWEIKPVGGFNKNISSYQQYLDCITEQKQQEQQLKADHFAKSFMFCASK